MKFMICAKFIFLNIINDFKLCINNILYNDIILMNNSNSNAQI